VQEKSARWMLPGWEHPGALGGHDEMQQKISARTAVVEGCRVKKPKPSDHLGGGHIAGGRQYHLGPLPVIPTVSAAQ
jgi:hypothetical protein